MRRLSSIVIVVVLLILVVSCGESLKGKEGVTLPDQTGAISYDVYVKSVQLLKEGDRDSLLLMLANQQVFDLPSGERVRILRDEEGVLELEFLGESVFGSAWAHRTSIDFER